VIVLVERAVNAEEIDAAAVEARRKQLAAERDAVGITEERLEEIDEELLLIDVQLRVARPGAETAH
jgi:F0F1-type ATP synthase epsilon subunit